MKITLCGSIKFMDEMTRLQRELEAKGHTVLMPVKMDGVDYWGEDNSTRIKAKRELGLVNKHLDKIEQSDAILVANVTKGDIEHYIGANTFLEIGFAYYRGKKIFLLNPPPKQAYIADELVSFDGTVLSGNLSLIA